MLPFTLVDALGWVMIPVVSLTAFLVLCIEQLAVQIENPFGYDANDLPLHSFTCCVEAGPLRQLTVALLAAPSSTPAGPGLLRALKRRARAVQISLGRCGATIRQRLRLCLIVFGMVPQLDVWWHHSLIVFATSLP